MLEIKIMKKSMALVFHGEGRKCSIHFCLTLDSWCSLLDHCLVIFTTEVKSLLCLYKKRAGFLYDTDEKQRSRTA